MTASPATLSDQQLQEALLTCRFDTVERQPVELAARRFNPYSSRSVTEIATCRSVSGMDVDVLVKYEANDEGTSGHRGGTRLEAMVYERILGPLGLRPVCFGCGRSPATGQTWLAMEYIHDAIRVSKGPQPLALRAAADWLAQFHTRSTPLIHEPTLHFLRRYDARYYMSWVTRTIDFVGDAEARRPWFAHVCRRAEDAFQLLAAAPMTIVHGEFYSQNILWSGDGVYPVDWESAAVGPAEIDLASLTENWPSGLRGHAMTAYCESRGIDAASPDLNSRVSAARMYWAYRWLGESREWAAQADWCFDTLQGAARDLGLLADA